MKKTKKVFLPKWQRFFIVPLMLGMWLFMIYLEFFAGTTKGEMGVAGLGFLTILFLGISIMFWLMTSGKLPAYLIEEEDEEEKK